MNNSKPRKGSGRRTAKKSGGSATRHQIPKGYPGAGRFVSRDAWELHWKDIAAELKKAERLARQAAQKAERQRRDREHKAAARARRQPLMAKADGVFVTNTELLERLSGWASRSTGHLKEKTVYAWHGVFYLQGSGAAMQKALMHAGSEARARQLPQTTDRQHSATVTPFFGNYTPTQAETEIPPHAEMMTAQYQRMGLSVVLYLGAFWMKI